MKINFTKEVHEETLISHIVLHGLTKALPDEKFKKFLKGKQKKKDYFFDIKITVDDIEIDLEDFVKHWQDQVDTMITRKAKSLIEDKCTDVGNLLCDLEERLKEEVEKRLDDWEKEDDEQDS